jgi:hypothetical protein
LYRGWSLRVKFCEEWRKRAITTKDPFDFAQGGLQCTKESARSFRARVTLEGRESLLAGVVAEVSKADAEVMVECVWDADCEAESEKALHQAESPEIFVTGEEGAGDGSPY